MCHDSCHCLQEWMPCYARPLRLAPCLRGRTGERQSPPAASAAAAASEVTHPIEMDAVGAPGDAVVRVLA